MSGAPKLSLFRAWAKPYKNTNGDGLSSRSRTQPEPAEDRKADLKRAAFFVTVAVLFVLVNHVGRVKDASEGDSAAGSAAPVSLTVSPPKRIAEGFSVRFRLSNRGNHSVFYPVGAETDAPVGQIVARTTPSSEWMSLPSGSKQQVQAVQEFVDQGIAWIEMPPGGWIDGEFRDVGEFSGEHAYAIFLKPARDAAAIRIVSKSYFSPAN